jgi:hypothetical protein
MVRRQSIVLNWLHKSKASLFVYWRLMLRGVVAITDIDPSIVAPKAVVVAAVVLMVHTNLRHHRIVHPLDECSAPMSLYATTVASRLIDVRIVDNVGVPG